MERAAVNPRVLRWARERSGLSQEALGAKLSTKMLPNWESGELQPTFRQVQQFADKAHVPAGYLFLSNPPEERIPIPDFRTVGGQPIRRPSPDLLDTIYACQLRQYWYHEFARIEGEPSVEFVGSATLEAAPSLVAREMRQVMEFDSSSRRKCSKPDDLLRMLRHQAEEAGVLVMVSSVVDNNNTRRLDPDEFRGFVLSDSLAPLVFVNGSDAQSAQIFTLSHELAHLWIGSSALSNTDAHPQHFCRSEEAWCNAVAAEFLVPLADLRMELQKHESVTELLTRLARRFKVSRFVVLRRLLDAQQISHQEFDRNWERLMTVDCRVRRRTGDGWDFYRTLLNRVGRRFASALVVSTLEGKTLYRDALSMLGISKSDTFETLAKQLGAIK